jgi:transposase
LVLLSSYHRRCTDKHSSNWGSNGWFLLPGNSPAYWSVLVKDFLTKYSVTTLEQPPYSPDFAAADLYLFPWLKSTMKVRRFYDATDIIKNATEELKKALAKWLPGMFPPPLQSLAEVYSCTKGLFWRKGSLNDCTVLYFSEIKWFREHSEVNAHEFSSYCAENKAVSTAMTNVGHWGPLWQVN